jgi:exodeoxyribonuclease VII large subunit
VSNSEDAPFTWNVDAPAEAGAEPGGAERSADRTWRVPEVAAEISAALGRTFPQPFWLAGEISGLNRSGRRSAGHLYFSLADDQCADDRSRASLSVILWKGQAAKLFGPRGKLAGQQPEDGMVLRVLVKPDWYAPSGRLSFIIQDVDPEFTLGNLDKQRRELLARLEAEGAPAINKGLVLPEVPLRLGLITSVDSAAYNDVMASLSNSDIGFHVLCCDARMQGAETSRSVIAALRDLAARRPDAILLVRGGGSRLDLSWFDKEDLVRAIVDCPVPVLTGIGHEIDSSVADVVSHRAFKTPTAVAEALVERARDARRQTEDAYEGILVEAARTLHEQRVGLVELARRIGQASRGRVREEFSDLTATSQGLRAATERGLASAGEALAEQRSRLVRGRHVARLSVLAEALVHEASRLRRAAGARLDAASALMDRAADRARLLDPRSVLARGFAWLRRADGSLLKDAAGATPGEALVAELRDGELDLEVGESRPRVT